MKLYTPEHADQARRLCATFAATDKGLAEFFDVPRGIIRKWQQEHQDFFEACTIRRELVKPGIINVVEQKALDGDLSAAMFWLRCNAGWTEKQSVDVTVTKSAQEMTRAELMQVIADDIANENRRAAH